MKAFFFRCGVCLLYLCKLQLHESREMIMFQHCQSSWESKPMCCRVPSPQSQSRTLLKESWWHCRGLWSRQRDGRSCGAVPGQVVTLNYSCCIQRAIPKSLTVIPPLWSARAPVCSWARGPQSANRVASYPLPFEQKGLDAKAVLGNPNGINLAILSGGLSK